MSRTLYAIVTVGKGKGWVTKVGGQFNAQRYLLRAIMQSPISSARVAAIKAVTASVEVSPGSRVF